ncbi:MAG: hypothetical protein J5936_04420 [Acholeplasmatales bacterium]|nr:hypothetical protein [Acholeplasmatales bacterium]MBQ6783549.1 hypothetical protein [Acholeplasmatales bacterium]
MKDNKFLTILGYILIIILLSPIIAVLLYLIIGGALFYSVTIYDRIKYGPSNIKEGKDYKLISTLLFIAAILIMFIIYNKNGLKFDIFTWRDFFACQGIAFVGFIPLVLYHLKRMKTIKENKN